MRAFQKDFKVLVLCVLSLVVGCSDDQSPEANQTHLIMATSADMPPFEFYKHAKIVGYDIDVAKAVAQKLGLELHIRDMDFSALIPALKAGRSDIALASMTPTTERKKSVDFSESYLSLPLAVVSTGESKITTEKDLGGRKIGVQNGSTHEQFAKGLVSKDSTIEVKSFNKLSDLVQELTAGRLDVVIMETKTARSFQKSTPSLHVSTLEGQTVFFAIALPKDSLLRPKINEALKELQASGRLDEIQRAWFSDHQL